MSAQAILAGLFPPRDEQLWNPKILWQPIPVHTVPVQDEKLLHFPMPGCKRFYQLLKETMGSTEVQSTLKSQMEFLGQMAKNMGYDVKSLMDFNNHKLWNAYDTLLVQKIHRKQLPSWANEDSIARLKFLMEYAVTAIFGIHKQEEKSRLQGGNLVKAILDKITKASQSNDEPKMVMYSAAHH
ncbi:prostatic acid phosphatase-like isoform X3 [Hemicordylus capensis]|uniref:prostatic acid phosphatase-like isoform X3 n=1 Tax=Hemicordylus capensis TaxID=884348 RepID=UPI0023024272|nr:prostatic acid phosphatase-like isoform X3 [Hemicordylus capensis]